MKNLILRACSGAVYVAIIIASLLCGGNWAFPLLCAILGLLAAMELFHMTEPTVPFNPARLLDIVIIVLMAATGFAWHAIPLTHILLLPLLIVLLILARFTTQLYSHRPDPTRQLGNSTLAYCYIGLPLVLTSLLPNLFSSYIALTMFAMIWLNDTGAYLVGCTLGRHRMFPRLSPKKSWEGFFGGLIFSIAGGVTARFIGFSDYTLWQLCLMGAIVTAFATWGDLMESMLKRNAGVKDSGHLIPGHGGILDRIDSLLFVGPATLILLFLF